MVFEHIFILHDSVQRQILLYVTFMCKKGLPFERGERQRSAQAMGGDVAWSWMPSPLNAAAYFCADLITIESDVFTASKVMFNCITLEPSSRSEEQVVVPMLLFHVEFRIETIAPSCP